LAIVGWGGKKGTRSESKKQGKREILIESQKRESFEVK